MAGWESAHPGNPRSPIRPATDAPTFKPVVLPVEVSPYRFMPNESIPSGRNTGAANAAAIHSRRRDDFLATLPTLFCHPLSEPVPSWKDARWAPVSLSMTNDRFFESLDPYSRSGMT